MTQAFRNETKSLAKSKPSIYPVIARLFKDYLS